MNIDMKYPTPEPVDFVIRKIINNGGKGYIVGGAVRDLILGRPVNDWDIATSFRPDEIEALFADMHTIPIGKRYGTILVIVDGMPIQVTTFRGEDGYEDYRHPNNVTFVRDIEMDLARRDFTINAIAYNPYLHPTFIDPMHGIADIDKKLIRAVGNPLHRFEEDPLRMMRGVRFLSQLGFDIEAKTRNAIVQNASLILKVSTERIRDELDKLLLGDFPYEGLLLMSDSGIYNYIFSPQSLRINDADNIIFLKMINSYPNDIILRLAAVINYAIVPKQISDIKIITQAINEVLHRLRYDRQTITHTSCIVSNVRNITFSQDGADLVYQIKKLISEVGRDDARRIVFIKECENSINKIASNLMDTFNQILERNEPIYLSDLAITGRDLVDSGIGRNNPEMIGKLLKLAHDWVLKCPQRNNRSYLLPRLQSIIKHEED